MALVTIAYIGLGSNLGESAETIHRAIGMLGETDGICVDDVSSFIETMPLGSMDQPGYVNSVVKVGTELTAEQLFERMVLIENELGRQRGEKWSARTIDLDMIMFGGDIIETDNLTVPHSQMHLRSFVLGGMCEIDESLVHPVLGRTMRELADRLNGNDYCVRGDRLQVISIAGVIGAGKTTLGKQLAERFSCELLCEAYDTNPFLAEVYAGNENLALDSQLYFLNTRFDQLRKDRLTSGKVVVSDYVFAKDKLFAERTLNAEQLTVYRERHGEVCGDIAGPVLVIYMKGSPELILDRIHSRNRSYEQSIEVETIVSLSDDYDRLLAGWDECPVITLNIEEFDCMDDDSVNKLANEILSYIWKQ